MGIVNRNNRFNDIIKVVKASKLSQEAKKELLDYIIEVKNNTRNNDFFEDSFLERIILELVKVDEWDNEFNIWDAIHVVKSFLPYGIKTENYENLKELIITNIGDFAAYQSEELLSLFDSKKDYLDIANLVFAYDNVEEIMDEATDFAVKVAPYCQNQSILKQEVIAFIYLIEKSDDTEELKAQCIEEAKKRVGIYPVDEKTLALIASEVRKAQGLIKKLEYLEKKITDYEKSVNIITKNGMEELQHFIDSEKDELIKRLDEYLLEIQKQLEASSDEVFKKILANAQKKINELKLMAQGLSNRTRDDLILLQNQTNDSIQALKDYVQNDPQVKELIKEAGGESKLKEILTSLQLTGSPVLVTEGVADGPVIETPPIYIPGNSRGIVPMNQQVVIPENMSHQILPVFDESIPFDERMKYAEKRMNEMKAKGEIFHELTEEVVRCVIEGDWVYLWGPSGCGKSYLIKQVAKILGIDLVENGKITDKYSVMAYNDPHGRFRATQAFVALVYGKMLSLDEFDNGNTDTQVVLNELYSGLLDVLEKPEEKRFITFAEDMSVPIHPNFRMISAGNTSGDGENNLFSSRGKIDEAVQERMTPKKFFYDNKVEKLILADYPAWYDLFVKFRTVCDDYARRNKFESAPGIITTRDAAAIAKYIRHDSKRIDQVLREKFVQVKDNSYLGDIMRGMRRQYGLDEKEAVDDVEEKDHLAHYTEKELGKRLIYACDQAVNTGRR